MSDDQERGPKLLPEGIRKAVLGAIDGPYRRAFVPINREPLYVGHERPTTSNADHWLLWLEEHADSENAYKAVQIAEAIDEQIKAALAALAGRSR